MSLGAIERRNRKIENPRDKHTAQGRILGEGAGDAHPPPPKMTCGYLMQLVFCKKKVCGSLVLK